MGAAAPSIRLMRAASWASWIGVAAGAGSGSGCGGGSPGPCPWTAILPSGEVRVAVGGEEGRRAVAVEDGSDARVTWEVADPGVASVSGDGRVRGRAAGATQLVARSDCGAEASVGVRVVGGMAVAPAAVELAPGDAASVVADGDGIPLTDLAEWSSDDDGVVVVDEPGLLRAVGEGTATVRARWQGLVGEAAVIVRAAQAPAAGTIAWRLSRWAPDVEDLEPGGPADGALPEVTLGDCGQNGATTHFHVAGLTDAPAPGGLRAGFGAMQVRAVEPEVRAISPFRTHLAFEPVTDGRLWLESVRFEFRSGGKSFEGNTLEAIITPDDPEFRPSEPFRFRLVDRRLGSGDCCVPEQCH